MLDLSFEIVDAAAVKFAESPLLELKVRITNRDRQPIHSIALRAQVQIEARRRVYNASEQEALADLFGAPERWKETLKTTLWAFSSAVVPPFADCTVASVPLPCSYDFNLASAKYFYALEDGVVPLCVLFSGTVFFEAEDGALQVAQIPWDREARFALPVTLWKAMMEHYYPDSAWLCLRRDWFDRLYRYKVRRGLTSFEQAIDELLGASEMKENA